MSATAGSNLPKLSEILPLALVESVIDAELRPLRERADELIGSCKRFIEAFPTIETEEQDAKAAEVLAVVQRFTSASGRVETARVALKAPILAADTAIGSLRKGPFARVAESVDVAAAAVRKASIAFKQKRDDEIRAKARAEADRLAEQARTAERLASAGSGLVTMEDAANAANAAETHQRTANARAADLTRSQGDQAGVTSLRYRREIVITSPADVPRHLCQPDEAAIRRAAGKAGGPIPTIPGVIIRDVPDITIGR